MNCLTRSKKYCKNTKKCSPSTIWQDTTTFGYWNLQDYQEVEVSHATTTWYKSKTIWKQSNLSGLPKNILKTLWLFRDVNSTSVNGLLLQISTLWAFGFMTNVTFVFQLLITILKKSITSLCTYVTILSEPILKISRNHISREICTLWSNVENTWCNSKDTTFLKR